MGKRIRYTYEKMQQFADGGYTAQQIADFYGVHRRTFWNWRKSDPELKKLFPEDVVVERDDKGRWLKGTLPNPEGTRGRKPLAGQIFQSVLTSREVIEGERAQAFRDLPTAKRQGNNITVERWALLAYALFSRAINGDTQAGRLLLEYALGRPLTRIEHTGEEGGPIKFDITEKREEAQHMLMRRIERIKEATESEN